MTQTNSGGCSCGRSRDTVGIQSNDAYFCHCRMCQRASGGVSMAFVSVSKTDVHWENAPDYYASSCYARRSFCGACGTSFGFEYPESEKCDLTVGSFDDPSAFLPTSQFGADGYD
jgi:hypothetical protein